MAWDGGLWASERPCVVLGSAHKVPDGHKVTAAQTRPPRETHPFSLPQTQHLGMRWGGEPPFPGDKSPSTQSTNRGTPPWGRGNRGCHSGPTTDSFAETHSLCPQPVASVKQTGVSVSVTAQASLRCAACMLCSLASCSSQRWLLWVGEAPVPVCPSQAPFRPSCLFLTRGFTHIPRCFWAFGVKPERAGPAG